MKNRIIKFRAFVETYNGKEMVNDWCFLNLKDNHFNAVDLTNERPDIGEVYAVMQFTGLHDKNGKEIYSKDLVRQGSDLYRIELCVGGFECIEIRELKKGRFVEGSTYSFSVLSDRYCEVIGNVFENPELLIDKK